MYEDEIEVTCPHCGAGGTVLVDFSGGREQSYVEDCGVCCRPWQVIVRIEDGEADVRVEPA